MSDARVREPRPRKTALVTGATAGIGAAFARQLAADGYDLVLVARGEQRLAEQAHRLAAQHGVQVSVLPADLSTDAGCAAVEARLRDGEPPVDILVNNAGIGVNIPFLQATVDDEERVLRLNVHAVMRLSLAALPRMVDRGAGGIVNVSSVAGFGVATPGSTYSASKAWVTNFSESIAASVRPFGVRMMALCPGYTRTEFHQRAGIDVSRAPGWIWLDADRVARDGLRDLRRGRVISVPDWKYKVATFGLRHMPRGLVGRVARDTRGRVVRAQP
jgi:short-subunit dehydrogenase